MGTTTTLLGLYKPSLGESGYDNEVNDSFDVIDAALGKLQVHGADIASAGTIDLDAATGDLLDLTGTTTVTVITLANGKERKVRTTGILTFTNGASLIMPSNSNIKSAAGDIFVFRGYAAGVVRCISFSPFNVSGLYTPTPTITLNLDTVTFGVTCHYMRVGNEVLIGGEFSADVTSAGSAAQFRIDLPIASAFTSSNQASGTFVSSNAASICGLIYSDATNDQLFFEWIQPSTPSNITYRFMCSYTIL